VAEFPALPLFTDAYMADTRHLTTTQHGAYLLLLMTAWRMPDCKLPDDDALLARWAGLDYRNWRKMRPLIIDQFWKKDVDGKLQQNRLLDERSYADSVRRKNAEAGKASALKRKERHSTSVPTKPQPESNPHTLPTPTIPLNPIPDWMPTDSWKAYLLVRSKKSNKPETLERVIKQLAKWRSLGHDVKAILDYSAMNGYQGLFEPKTTAKPLTQPSGQNGGYKNAKMVGAKND